MSRMTRHPFVFLGVIIILAVTVLVAFRLSTVTPPEKQGPHHIIVGTISPLKKDLDIHLTYTGDITPNQIVNLFSRVDGYIAKLHVDKGDFVTRNQVLLEIDHTDYQHAVNQAKANLAAGHARVSQQNAALRNAKLALDRMQALITDQFVSQQEFDNAQVNFEATAAGLASLQAQVKQMEVALAQAETNLAYSYIRAPFAGYIAERNLDTGAYVTGATASTSTMSRGILSLHDISTVRVLIEVVEKDIPSVKIGQKAVLRAEAYPEQLFEGTVTRIVQALNRTTRTMTVEIDLPNPDRRLKGGMFARVDVMVGTHPQAVQVPIDAISRLEDAQYVFVVREGQARRVSVEIGARSHHYVEVTSGLTGDEEVIVSGKDLVHDGTPVQTQALNSVKNEG